MCRGMDAGGSAELHNMQSPICSASEYAEELQRCIRDALEKCRGKAWSLICRVIL